MLGRVRGLQREIVTVGIRYDNAKMGVPVTVYLHPETTDINSVWIHGFGAGRIAVANTLAAQRTARFRGASVVLPYHPVPVAALEHFTNEALPQIVEALHPSGKIVAAGESRGAGAVAIGAAHIPSALSRIGMLEPSFINSKAMGDNPRTAVREILRRLTVQNTRLLEQPFHGGAQEAARGMAIELSTIAFVEGMSGLRSALGTAVDPGIAERTIDGLSGLVAAGVDVSIYGGTKDPVFPYHELKAALQPSGLDAYLFAIDAPHVSPGTPEGLRHVQRVMGDLAFPAAG